MKHIEKIAQIGPKNIAFIDLMREILKPRNWTAINSLLIKIYLMI